MKNIVIAFSKEQVYRRRDELNRDILKGVGWSRKNSSREPLEPNKEENVLKALAENSRELSTRGRQIVEHHRAQEVDVDITVNRWEEECKAFTRELGRPTSEVIEEEADIGTEILELNTSIKELDGDSWKLRFSKVAKEAVKEKLEYLDGLIEGKSYSKLKNRVEVWKDKLTDAEKKFSGRLSHYEGKEKEKRTLERDRYVFLYNPWFYWSGIALLFIVDFLLNFTVTANFAPDMSSVATYTLVLILTVVLFLAAHYGGAKYGDVGSDENDRKKAIRVIIAGSILGLLLFVVRVFTDEVAEVGVDQKSKVDLISDPTSYNTPIYAFLLYLVACVFSYVYGRHCQYHYYKALVKQAQRKFDLYDGMLKSVDAAYNAEKKSYQKTLDDAEGFAKVLKDELNQDLKLLNKVKSSYTNITKQINERQEQVKQAILKLIEGNGI